jgi:rhodanese-related sulfurtransferase
MQKILIFVSEQWLLITLLFLVLFLIARIERKKAGISLTSNELTQLMNKEDVELIDLREKPDFNEGHIVGATNLPFQHWQSKNKKNEDLLSQYHNKTIVLVCKMGQQSSFVAKSLSKEAGDKKIYRLAGGVMEWKASQMPLVK